MDASCCLFSGFDSVSSVPAGSLANASFVGANTVKGPVPDNVSARPAAFTPATKVEKSGLLAAVSTIVFAAGVVVIVESAAVVGGLVVAALLLEEQAPRAR